MTDTVNEVLEVCQECNDIFRAHRVRKTHRINVGPIQNCVLLFLQRLEDHVSFNKTRFQ